MAEHTLVIGNKNYSSWSMRAWLVLTTAGIAFEERRLHLGNPEHVEQLLTLSPNGKVPCLKTPGAVVWESLAIAEYAAEIAPRAGLWPDDLYRRAVCRSACAEMHAGFEALRRHMPMNIRAQFPGRGRTPEVEKEIERIRAIWRTGMNQYGGPFLFGSRTVADAMFAPVVTRFIAYGVSVGEAEMAYIRTISTWEPFQEWVEAARAETAVLPEYEF